MKDNAWLTTIKWDESCEICRSLHNGNCPSIKCAKNVYDNNGSLIPELQYEDLIC